MNESLTNKTIQRFLSLFLILGLGNSTFSQSFHRTKSPAPQPGTLFIYPERIPLKTSGTFACQRGLMFVPINRDRKSSDVIGVEFYKLPRSSMANPNTPPIFLLKGGPGFPGLEKELEQPGNLERRYFHLLKVSDVVIVGQRGIGTSKPNTLIEQVSNQQRPDRPYDEKLAREEFQKSLAKERQFWLDQGVDLDGFNVVQAAADVNDIARALGYQKIIIYGGSFGSHWGMTVMRNHATLVARAVLTGLEGPNHTWDHPGWIWNVYKRVAKEAEASERLKNIIPEDGLISQMEKLVRQAKAKPFKFTIFRGRPNEMTAFIDERAMQYVARGISRKLKDWPAEVIQMSRGNYSNATVAVVRRAQRNPRSFRTASYWMLDSGSGISPQRRLEVEADPAASTLGDINWHYTHGCPVWKSDLGNEFRMNFKTEIPTVFVQGTWDTQTPYENALELKPYFTNLKFVTVHRGTHGALVEAEYSDRTFRPALLEFINSGSTKNLPEKIELPEPAWTIPR